MKRGILHSIAGGVRASCIAIARTLGHSARLDALDERPLDRALEMAEKLWPRLMGDTGRPTNSVLFVAPDDDCGHGLVATASAIALARHLRETIGVVELDFEKPLLADLLEVRARAGTSEYLRGTSDLESIVVRPAAHPHLQAVTGGSPRSLEPGELSIATLERLCSEVQRMCRTTIYVAPALERCQDVRLLAGRVDGVVCVFRAGTTTKIQVQRTLELLEESGARLVGSVLTGYDYDLPRSAA